MATQKFMHIWNYYYFLMIFFCVAAAAAHICECKKANWSQICVHIDLNGRKKSHKLWFYEHFADLQEQQQEQQ